MDIEQLSLIADNLKSTDNRLFSLNENVESLISGMQLLLNVVSNHEKLLCNIDQNNLQQNSGASLGVKFCKFSDINVGANENISNVSALTNVDLDILDLSNVDLVDNMPEFNLANNNNECDLYEDISSIAIDNDLHDVINPEFKEISIVKSISAINKDDNQLTDSIVETDDEIITSELSLSSDLSSIYEGFHHAPYDLHHKGFFSLFKVAEMEKSTSFNTHFENRSVAFYGHHPYKYSNIVHEPKPFETNTYLMKLLSYVGVVYPEAEYNTAMIHKYSSGEKHIPMHSDSETDIVDGSSIITISLGDTRTLHFQEKDSSHNSSVSLEHGDTLIMTKASQRFFSHGIPLEEGKGLRISITLRLLHPPKSDDDLKTTSQFAPTQYPSHAPSSTTPSSVHSQPPNSAKFLPKQGNGNYKRWNTSINTIYISSSMFRFLKPHGLSSGSQNAKVFFYPGANATQMLSRLLQDREFNDLDKKKVTQVFVLSGTNNVDSIYSNTQSVADVNKSLSSLLHKLWMVFDNVRINVINILPREHRSKNEIVYQLNQFLYKECKTHGLNFIDTEYGNMPMFTLQSGLRDNKLFSNGYDNVHLNPDGLSKLARYLKFLAHQR